MTTFQLDECSNSGAFANNCESSGLARIWRYPKNLRGKSDPEMLAALLPRNNPIVSTDLAIMDEHSDHIPIIHPGIILIGNADAVLKTFTMPDAQKLLSHLKTQFNDWHQCVWRNSVVRLTQLGVDVWHRSGAEIHHDGFIGFSERDWISRFAMLLERNASRG